MKNILYIVTLFLTKNKYFDTFHSDMSNDLSPTQKTLIELGLTQNQSLTYTYLLENGPKTASIIARRTKIARTLLYKVLDDLEEMKLVSRDDKPGSISLFIPHHPNKLARIVEEERAVFEEKTRNVNSILTKLTSVYNKNIGQPGVATFEGVEGIQAIYSDVITSNRNKGVKVIRSYLDNDTLGEDFYKKYIKQRAEQEIFAEIISPKPANRNIPPGIVSAKQNFLHMPELAVPAEIQIYDDKVSIIAFEEPLIGTIIEKPAVAETMREIFNYLWKQANAEEEE